MSDDVKRLIAVLQSKGQVITTEDVEYIAGVISENEWLGFDEEEESKVCCNCKHNIRTGKVPNIECHCEIDGSYIGYVQCMEYRCEHWEKEENDNP